MSDTQVGEGDNDTTGDEVPSGNNGYASVIGKTRMVLAGTLTIDSALAPGASDTGTIVVQVTYE